MFAGTVKITAELIVKLPMLPDFLRRGDDLGSIDIAELSDDMLRRVGEAWTTALLNHANQRRLPRVKV